MEQKLAEAMVEGHTQPSKSSAAYGEDLLPTEELDSDGEEEGEGAWTRVEEGSMDMASSSGSSAADKQVELEGGWEGQSGRGRVGGVLHESQSSRGEVGMWEDNSTKHVVCATPTETVCHSMRQVSFACHTTNLSLPLLPQYSSLASFLVDRACSSTRLANFFFWWVTTQGVTNVCICIGSLC